MAWHARSHVLFRRWQPLKNLPSNLQILNQSQDYSFIFSSLNPYCFIHSRGKSAKFQKYNKAKNCNNSYFGVYTTELINIRAILITWSASRSTSFFPKIKKSNRTIVVEEKPPILPQQEFKTCWTTSIFMSYHQALSSPYCL